jgi:hypothetical protein
MPAINDTVANNSLALKNFPPSGRNPRIPPQSLSAESAVSLVARSATAKLLSKNSEAI